MAVPAPPTRWVWRLAGLGLALGGALLLADRLPALLPRLVPWRGLLVAMLALGAFSITGTSWVGAAPVLPRIPWNVAGVALVGLVVGGAARLGVPRFTRWVIPLVVTLGCVVLGHPFLAMVSGLFALLCLFAQGVAWVAARGGAATHGDVAFAVFVGYALGQWIPLM